MNLAPSTEGEEVCVISDFLYKQVVTMGFSEISSVCTPLESTLGVRETFDDLPPFRNIFDISEFVELLKRRKTVFLFFKQKVKSTQIQFDF